MVLILSVLPAASYIYTSSTLQKKPFPIVPFSYNLSFLLTKFLQTTFQTLLVSFSSVVLSSYMISFSYRNPERCRYLSLFPNRGSATSVVFHLLVYHSLKSRTLPSVVFQPFQTYPLQLTFLSCAPKFQFRYPQTLFKQSSLH